MVLRRPMRQLMQMSQQTRMFREDPGSVQAHVPNMQGGAEHTHINKKKNRA
jgi:hypothetical protein